MRDMPKLIAEWKRVRSDVVEEGRSLDDLMLTKMSTARSARKTGPSSRNKRLQSPGATVVVTRVYNLYQYSGIDECTRHHPGRMLMNQRGDQVTWQSWRPATTQQISQFSSTYRSYLDSLLDIHVSR